MSPMSSMYLLAYNGAMFLGWAAILVKMVQNLMHPPTSLPSNVTVYQNAYNQVEYLLYVFQTGAVLEIFHAAFGIVRSPVATTFLQVLSRLMVLYGALRVGSTEPTSNYFSSQMIIAWACSEVIRYSFYCLPLLNMRNSLVTWLRYSGFLILYPLGITGEIACLYLALDYIHVHKPYSTELPNAWNFTFSLYNFIWFLLVGVYPFGSYVMYTYMLSQRRKNLSPKAAEGKRA